MARKNRRSRDDVSFVMVTWDMLNSKAFIDLPPSAGKALPYFSGKPHKHIRDPELYESTFKFSYGEAKRLGFAASTFSDIIKSLVKHGFIDPVAKGGLRGTCKSNNVFRLSRRWQKYATDEFKEVNWGTFQPSGN